MVTSTILIILFSPIYRPSSYNFPKMSGPFTQSALALQVEAFEASYNHVQRLLRDAEEELKVMRYHHTEMVRELTWLRSELAYCRRARQALVEENEMLRGNPTLRDRDVSAGPSHRYRSTSP